MVNNLYIEVNGKPVMAETLHEWAEFMKTREPKARTEVFGFKVSTVFLGVDYDWNEENEPYLYETMVFGGVLSGRMVRATNQKTALANHDNVVKGIENFMTNIRRERTWRRYKRKYGLAGCAPQLAWRQMFVQRRAIAC